MRKQIRKLKNVLLVAVLLLFGFIAKQPPVSAAPFTCDPGFYQSMTLGSLKRLNVQDGVYETIGASSAVGLNAIGYNSVDNYIYGINNTVNDALVRVEHDATTTNLGIPAGLSSGNYVAGDMDHSGNLYTTDGTNLWIIDVSAVTASSVTLSASLTSINDMVHIGGFLYGTNGTSLFQIDITDGTVVTKSLGLTATVYGAGWATAEGKLYFSQNANGKIYEITGFTGLSPNATEAFAGEGGLAGNDGAACSLAASVIEPINAVDDTGETTKDTPLVVSEQNGLLNNDTPVDATIDSYAQPSHGAVVVNPDGSYTYTPEPGFVGSDSFTYTIINSVGETDTATVYLTVSEIPAAPTTTLADTGNSLPGLATLAITLIALSFIGLRRFLPRHSN